MLKGKNVLIYPPLCIGTITTEPMQTMLSPTPIMVSF